MRTLATALCWTAHNLGLLLATAALHVLIAYGLYTTLYELHPVAPRPTLITDSIEMLIAETEAELPIEAATPTLAAAKPVPTPQTAAYLVAPDATINLTPPDLDPELPELAQPTEWSPPAPPAGLFEINAELPEITLPPAELQTPAAGATARQDRPKLTTNIQTYLRKHYPTDARRNGWEGKVTLQIEVSDDGRVAEASIQTSSGYASLDRAALKMMRRARYTHGPATLTQTIEYKLR